ncbi:MAG: (d)CMP kinase [Phycisphaerae bacterium]|nr:(d)CMP kinase [Phycisphaerae bacterium]
MIITIDGPAGSGKSTAARNLARALGIAFLDTGATYRAVTLRALREKVDLADESAVADVASRVKLRMQAGPDGVAVFDGDDDITQAIRTEEVSENSHYAASPPAVREILVDLQRQMGRQLGQFVTEGRDQGSVVFPDADVKFFLLAAPEARARRRVEQLAEAGETAEYETVLAAIVQRDQRDSQRAVGPLVKPDGAIEIDTTPNTPDETLAALLRAVEATR